MTMKTYIQPTMNVVRIQQQHIICTSGETYGLNNSLQSEETVDEAWTKRNNSSVDWDDDWSK